jgi:hypothetical protein
VGTMARPTPARGPGQSSKAARSSSPADRGWSTGESSGAEHLGQGRPPLPCLEKGADGAQRESPALEAQHGPEAVEVLLAVATGPPVERGAGEQARV